MKLVSFNVNGLRSRLHQLEALVQSQCPDIIGLQETKVQDAEFPREAVEALGYEVSFYGQKGHYGVALLSRKKPLEVHFGFPTDAEDAQRRLITGLFELPDGRTLRVINGYFPQGENRAHPLKFPAKQKFYADLHHELSVNRSPDELLALMGDMNISTTDDDIGIGEDNARRWLRTGKCSFLPEERQWMRALLDWGLEDSYRACPPQEKARYSWFDYRSKGFDRDPRRGLRIDLILNSRALQQHCVETGIDYEIRSMDRPSDHCPIWARYDL